MIARSPRRTRVLGAPTFSVDPDGRIRALNRAAEALFGLDADAVRGDAVADYLDMSGKAALPSTEFAARGLWSSCSGTLLLGPYAGHVVHFRTRGLVDASGQLSHVLLVGEPGPGLGESHRARNTSTVTRTPPGSGPVRSPAAESVLRGASGSSLRHRIERLAAVEEVLFGADGPVGAMTVSAILGTLARRFRELGGLRGDRIEFCADATAVPLFAVPSVTLVLHETLWVLLSGPGNASGRDTVRIVLWSDVNGSWRLIARSVGDRLQKKITPTGELAAFIGHLGGVPLPEGFSGAGIALAFPPFGTRPIH